MARLRKPLKLSCTSASCEENLHCFKATKEMVEKNSAGACRYCNHDSVDWPRLHLRKIRDSGNTVAELKKEYIRHYFWHLPLTQHSVNYAMRKGVVGMKVAIRKRVESAIGAAEPFHDGWQTPIRDLKNPIHNAQHATATCCRKCLEYWHGIELGRELTESELDYLCRLVEIFVEEKLPKLPQFGVKVPWIRNPH